MKYLGVEKFLFTRQCQTLAGTLSKLTSILVCSNGASMVILLRLTRCDGVAFKIFSRACLARSSRFSAAETTAGGATTIS